MNRLGFANRFCYQLRVSLPAVVRIFATTQERDYDAPWRSCTPSTSTGSGVVIAPGRVLTAAHVVANATFLQVQKVSEPDKLVARVAAVCHDCDLALLEVSDPRLMDGLTPAELGELPDRRERVSVIGYPVGGEEISITEGVVSRIEIQHYSHSQRNLLAITVDAAINSGNSGGPVYRDGKVIGIAFQTHRDGENIGDVVPTTFIRRFLKAVAQKTSADVPSLGIRTQNLENPQLRRHIGLSQRESGVLVTAVRYEGSCEDVLQPGDALLEVDGMPVANNGTVNYLGKYRTRFDVGIGERYLGDTVRLKVLRNGQRIELSAQLAREPYLVLRDQYDRAPRYFVFAGFVFQVLTRDYLKTWDEWWNRAPTEFLMHYHLGSRSPDRREVVLLSQVLADEINVGYAHLYSESITSVNGHRPRDFDEFIEHFERALESGSLTLRTSHHGLIVLDADQARARNPEILARYDIPVDRSFDLRRDESAS